MDIGKAATVPSPHNVPGTSRLLGDRYRLATRIAVGGMGEVWSAHDELLDREVAVKVLRNDLAGEPSFLRRFRGEALHAASLSHPGIARVYDYGEDEVGGPPMAYLVMEMVPGAPLSHVLARNGPLPVPAVISLLVQAADALQAAHRTGLVHRDVKPGNLLLTDDHRVKITDFGIARAADAAPITEVGQISGTASYMSPEQAAGGDATPASDVYSLAIVGYELLIGHPPFRGAPLAVAIAQMNALPPPLPAAIPGELRALLQRALDKDPRRRPIDAGAFAAELRALAGEDAAAGSSLARWSMSSAVMPAPTAVTTDDPTAPATGLRPGSSPDTEIDVGSDVTAIAPFVPSRGLVDAPRLTSARALRRLVTGAILVLVVLLTVITVRRAGNSAAGAVAATTSTSSPGTTATTAPPVASVTVDPDAVIGSPTAEARDDLRRAGFVVTVSEIAGPVDRAGKVLDVQPNGAVPFGATITLSVGIGDPTAATPATPKPKDKDKGKGKGHG